MGFSGKCTIHTEENYKRILVTGGLGFIGSALIFRLLEKTKCKIFNIDKLIQKPINLYLKGSINVLRKKINFENIEINQINYSASEEDISTFLFLIY